MNHLTPIELLKERLKAYQRAFHKSCESFDKGEISEDLHNTHKKNLQPLIFKYKQAITCLENWLD